MASYVAAPPLFDSRGGDSTREYRRERPDRVLCVRFESVRVSRDVPWRGRLTSRAAGAKRRESRSRTYPTCGHATPLGYLSRSLSRYLGLGSLQLAPLDIISPYKQARNPRRDRASGEITDAELFFLTLLTRGGESRWLMACRSREVWAKKSRADLLSRDDSVHPFVTPRRAWQELFVARSLCVRSD